MSVQAATGANRRYHGGCNKILDGVFTPTSAEPLSGTPRSLINALNNAVPLAPLTKLRSRHN